MRFSVLMAVYKNDNPVFFRESLESLFQQALRPDEVVLVEDGPISDELAVVVDEAVKKYGSLLKVIPLPENAGLAVALNQGLKHCSYEWVARMDADDVCLPGRFRAQMDYLEEHPDVDVISSWIEERDEKLEKGIACRKVPKWNDEIRAYAKWRNPMNHMTVIFRKSAVLKAGGYPEQLRKIQDYGLWGKMLHDGFIFANIQQVLLLARTGVDFYSRRLGWGYFRYERRLLVYFLKIRFVNIFEFTANLLVRFFCRISPKKFAGFIYKQLRGSHKPRGSFSFSRKKYGVKLSVLMSVYYKDNAGYLAESLNSVFQQTLQPDEVVLVQDGPLSDELLVVAAQAVKEHGDLLKVIPLPVNVGLQNALNEGLKHCSGEWVARMDADDVCLPERFKVQMEHLAEDPDIDVIGSWIDERDEKLETSIACRKVPQQNDKIIAYAKWRNPMNHMTVMFRKDAVLAAGGYPDCLKFEDYALWATMLKEGFIFANIPRVLLLARTGEDFYDRRSGWDYFHYERRLLAYLLKIRFVNIFEFTVNFLVRFCCRILPRPAVRFIYDVLRKK